MKTVDKKNQLSVYDELLHSLADIQHKPDFKYSGAFNVDGNYFYIKKVRYQNPATIVFWSDGTKTVTKCTENDTYSAETGLVMCVLKKLIGATKTHDLLENWVLRQQTLFSEYEVTLADVRSQGKR